MASTILCTTGAARGDPDRLAHRPLPKSRPPVGKGAADQEAASLLPRWTGKEGQVGGKAGARAGASLVPTGIVSKEINGVKRPVWDGELQV